jgi:hypothetical protein
MEVADEAGMTYFTIPIEGERLMESLFDVIPIL